MTIYEDEIDLRPYIDAILKHWWKISLLAISLAVFVFIFLKLQAPVYQATATILVPRSQLKLSLTNQFPTIVDAGDTKSRMEAYLTIAQSTAIAKQTDLALQDVLPAEYTVTELQKDVEISNTGDAILITVTAPSAELAAEIANEWADQIVQAVNLAYNGEQPLEEIQLQLAAGAEKYQGVQKELETFIEHNPITEIETTLILAEATLNAYIADETWQIKYLYQQKQQFAQISDQAEFVQNQIESGNASQAGDLGDALAVMHARARTFSAFSLSSDVLSNPPAPSTYTANDFGIQISDPNSLLDSSSNYAKDMQAVIRLADEAHQKIAQDIEVLLTSSDLGAKETYTALSAEIQKLKAQVENLQAHENELTNERDLAWDTYRVLLQKETEIKTTAQTNPVVTFASPAIPPEGPESNQTLMKTALAGILGGMIGILWVLVQMWWQSNQQTGEDLPQTTED